MTLSELVYHRDSYSARQDIALYMALGAIILNVLFPYIAYPVTYVLGIIGAISIMSYSSLSYFIAIRKSFKRYKTSGLVSYKISTLLSAYWWMALGILLVVSAIFPIVSVATSKIIIFVILMYCIYIESEIMISDKEVFPVKVGTD